MRSLGDRTTTPSVSEAVAALVELHDRLTRLRGDLDEVAQAVETLAGAWSSTLADAPALLTVEEAGRLLRVGRTRVFELLQAGELAGVRLGRKRCVTRRSLDALLARREGGEAAADG